MKSQRRSWISSKGRGLLGGLALVLAACAPPQQGAGPGSPPRPLSPDAAYQSVLTTLGGRYADAGINQYFSTVGQQVAAAVGADTRWRFTVVDHEAPNAHATSAGDLFITRGLLALLDNEAQLAFVIAHEMGHIVLRHPARTVERERTEIAPVVRALEQSSFNEAGRLLVQGALRMSAFNRESEIEADRYAVSILAKAGYPVEEAEKSLARLRSGEVYVERRMDLLSAGIEKRNPLDSHPLMAQRLAAVRAAAAKGPDSRDVARDRYLGAIDGMVIGFDPRIGVMRNGQFLHAALGMKLTVPDGYVALPNRNLPLLVARDRSRYMIGCNEQTVSGPMTDWLRERMRMDAEAFPMSGFDAATIGRPVRFANGTGQARVVAIRKDSAVCLAMLIVPPGAPSAAESRMIDSLRSVARLSDSDLNGLRPSRLRIHQAVGGETLEAMSRRGGWKDFELDYVRVMNAVEPGHRFAAGERLKTLVRD